MKTKIEKLKFYECIECLAKPGSPQLCTSCWQRRNMIEVLNELIDRENARTGEGEKCGEILRTEQKRGYAINHLCQNQKGQCPIHDKKLPSCSYGGCDGRCGGRCPEAQQETKNAKSVPKPDQKKCYTIRHGLGNDSVVCEKSPQPTPTATEGWEELEKALSRVSSINAVLIRECVQSLLAQTKEAERARAVKIFSDKFEIMQSRVRDLLDELK